jgi:hypothetical protein
MIVSDTLNFYMHDDLEWTKSSSFRLLATTAGDSRQQARTAAGANDVSAAEDFVNACWTQGRWRISWSFFAGSMGAWAIMGPAAYAVHAGVLGMLSCGTCQTRSIFLMETMINNSFKMIVILYFQVTFSGFLCLRTTWRTGWSD